MTAPEEPVPPAPLGPGSFLWDYSGLRLAAITDISAFVLQAMHPAIGAAAERLTDLDTRRLSRAVHDFVSIRPWVYGEQGTRHLLPAGPLAWAHLATFYVTVTAARYFSAEPMTLDREQRIFEEFLLLGRLRGVPARMLPSTMADYWAYFEDMLTHTLVPHPVAHRVLDRLGGFSSTVPVTLRPLLVPFGLRGGWFTHLVTVGTLPQAARTKLGLTWMADDEHRLRAVGTLFTRVLPHLPERLRYAPSAYQARRTSRMQRSPRGPRHLRLTDTCPVVAGCRGVRRAVR